MFSPDEPRLFGVPPGADFPAALIAGLEARCGADPMALARVTLIVNTERMARRLRQLFDAGPPRLLPRILLLDALPDLPEAGPLPPAVGGLERRLELIQLVSGLLDKEPDMAPRASLFGLADSLARLIAEMQGEGVDAGALEALDVGDQSGHWARSLRFVTLVEAFLSASGVAPDAEVRQRRAVEQLAQRWAKVLPQDPVIIAGSTGSRGQTALLMEAVARLPQGALVLPGYDFDMPETAWADLDQALTSEDHPQYRYRHLMARLDVEAGAVAPWSAAPAPAPARNAALSLALRPAPVTGCWLREGPSLPPLVPAFEGVTLVEAASQREEALAIALRLRAAAEAGEEAALISPDRLLTRQVTAALDRWGIVPDDSAGIPLGLTPPGRFLRHVADLERGPLTSEALLVLLKHPLSHSGVARADHLRHTRDLELFLRREGPAYPDATVLAQFTERHGDAGEWVHWIAEWGLLPQTSAAEPVPERLQRMRARAERIAAGPVEGSGGLWDLSAGREARALMDELATHGALAGEMTARDFADLVGGVITSGQDRNADAVHPHIKIWGTLEARVQGAGLVILAGLNDGTWPARPSDDPWLNRAMRHQAGLLLPERTIGLAAHDFQQAAGAPEVWLTRSIRSDEAETVPSRWINRLTGLLEGLPERGGPEALGAMRQRGGIWLGHVQQMEATERSAPASRPAPAPPAEVRPKALWVTHIRTLARDPYAIYARHILGLKRLGGLDEGPDALLRGNLIHDAMEVFCRKVDADAAQLTEESFMQVMRDTLAAGAPWAVTRALWEARMARIAAPVVAEERARRAALTASHYEIEGRAEIPAVGFTLHAKADRVGIDPRGNLHIFDYKTGDAPSEKQQLAFDNQLLLEAALAERGGFDGIGGHLVERAAYLSLKAPPKETPAPLDKISTAEIWAQLQELLSKWADPARGYTARMAMEQDRYGSDYDQLARFGEWDLTALPVREVVG